MAALTGGLRDRMLVESVRNAIVGELTAKGWFAGGRQHSSINVLSVYPPDDVEPPVNSLVVSMGSYIGDLAEMGSKLEEHYTLFYIDFFGEDRAVATELMGDIWSFLRKNPVLPVYDYREDPDTIEFYIEVDEDSMDVRNPEAARPFQRHWFVLQLGVWDLRSNV